MSAQGTPAGAPAGSPAPIVAAGSPVPVVGGTPAGAPAPQVVQQQPLTTSYVLPYGGYPYQAYGGYPFQYPAYQPAPAQKAEEGAFEQSAPQYYYPQQFPYATSFIAAPQAEPAAPGPNGTPAPAQEQFPQQYQYAYPPVSYQYSPYGYPNVPAAAAGGAPAKKAAKKKGFLCC